MANSKLTTDLRAMHDAIVAEISAAFPVFQTVEFYRPDRKEMPTPACILELDELPTSPDSDPGNGQQAQEARFVAHLVIGFLTNNARLEIRLLASAVSAFLHERRWAGVTCDHAIVAGAYEDDFKPELDQFECWRVEWSHIVFIGTDVWDETGAVRPQTVFMGQSPDIGAGNEDKYTRIVPQ